MRARTYDTTEEWLAARAEDYGIGASTVGALLGLSGYRTPWDVWASHHAPDALPVDATADQRRGHALEAEVARVYGQTHRYQVEHHDRTIWTHDTQPWARCSPDATVTAEGVVGLAEIKTSRGGWAWRDVAQDIRDPAEVEDLPVPAYGIQCYWQLLISGRPWVDLVVLPIGHDVADIVDALADSPHAGAVGPLVDALASRLVVCRVHASVPFQRQLGAWVQDWRARHLIKGEEPLATGSRYAGPYHGRQPKEGGLSVDIEHPITRAADVLWHARRTKKEATDAEKKATTMIKQAAQGVETVTTPRGVVRWRKHGKGYRLILDDWAGSPEGGAWRGTT